MAHESTHKYEPTCFHEAYSSCVPAGCACIGTITALTQPDCAVASRWHRPGLILAAYLQRYGLALHTEKAFPGNEDEDRKLEEASCVCKLNKLLRAGSDSDG